MLKKLSKPKILLLLLLPILALYSCGGESSGTYINPPKVETVTTSTTIFSKTNPDNLTFSWSVDPSSYDNQYYVDIYLSKDNDSSRNENNILIASKECYSSQDNITLTPDSEGYQKIMDSYGGLYSIVIDIYNYKDGERSDTVKTISNFVVKNIWTIMVYMDGDNSLSDATYNDLNEMQEIGSNKYVGILVQDDTSDSTAKRYFIAKGSINLLSDIGEVNMGDYNTLINFAKWSITNYPANHYLLVLWDHGKGFENVITTTSKSRDILWDNHPITNYSMTIPNLAKALSEIKSNLNRKIDIVGMDACLMNMIEVAYGIRNYANYMVGSENTEPYNGWPYDTIISSIEDNATTITPKEVAEEIVKDYINSYSSSYYPTQAAIDLANIDNLTNSVNLLAITLIDNMSTTIKNTIKGPIFDSVQRFDENGDNSINTSDSYADLYDLAKLIYQNDNMTISIKNAAKQVLNSFSNAIVLSEYKSSTLENSHGLSIWFPDDTNYYEYIQHYDNLSFSKDTSWKDLLKILMTP